MIKTTTRNLRVGSAVMFNGQRVIVTAKSKAFKAPEYYITFGNEHNATAYNFHSNKKWEVLDLVF